MSRGHIHKRVYQGVFIGSSIKLTPQSLNRLVRAFSSWESAPLKPLNGRAAVKYMTFPETGPVVVKSYCRGGMMARLTQNRYLHTGVVRSKREFNFLMHGAQAGVKVPRPLIYASRGFPFYQSWLITQKIRGHVPFTSLAMKNPEEAATLMPFISTAINQLIQHRILHVDLHPGNVLINANKIPHIIDFDKARFASWLTKKQLASLYKKRWVKAVQKHNLPEFISSIELKQI